MAVTAADIKAFAPEFVSVSDSIINTWLAWAPGYVAPRRFPHCEDQAVTLWTCHVLTRTASGAGGTAGPVLRDRVGDVERENADLKGFLAEDSWNFSGYGQQLVALARRFIAGGVVL